MDKIKIKKEVVAQILTANPSTETLSHMQWWFPRESPEWYALYRMYAVSWYKHWGAECSIEVTDDDYRLFDR